MTTFFLGLDPGASGAVAVIDSAGEFVDVFPFKGRTLAGLWAWIRLYGPEFIERQSDKAGCEPVRSFAVLEKVGGYVATDSSGGGGHQPGARMFEFGASYGRLEGLLVASGFVEGISYRTAAPQTWQKVYNLRREKGETDTRWKNRLKDEAADLFPETKVTLQTADALLLAEFCRKAYS